MCLFKRNFITLVSTLIKIYYYFIDLENAIYILQLLLNLAGEIKSYRNVES